MMRLNAIFLAMILAAMLAGCDAPKGPVQVQASPPKTVETIDKLIFAVQPPTVLNFNDKPGPDGMNVLVYLSRRDQPLAVTVNGTLVFTINEEITTDSRPHFNEKPFHTWTYSGAELNRHLVKTMFGWAYSFQLDWGDHVPTSKRIIVWASYRPTAGKPDETVDSEPVLLPMDAR